MSRSLLSSLLLFAFAACSGLQVSTGDGSRTAATVSPATPPAWSMNATIIEACSCPMFCQCYFNARPAGIGCCSKPDDSELAKRYCRFNNAFHVNRGSHNGTSLDGIKFWVAGDLGADFSQGQMQWAILHFDPAVTKAQREGVQAILGALYPVKWQNFSIGRDAPMEWIGGKDRSVARLDGGKLAEVVLKRNQGMTDEPIVMHNLRYWGAPRNDGFVMMANEVEAYRGEHGYEFKGTNGFMITVDINADDVAAAAKGR